MNFMNKREKILKEAEDLYNSKKDIDILINYLLDNNLYSGLIITFMASIGIGNNVECYELLQEKKGCK